MAHGQRLLKPLVGLHEGFYEFCGNHNLRKNKERKVLQYRQKHYYCFMNIHIEAQDNGFVLLKDGQKLMGAFGDLPLWFETEASARHYAETADKQDDNMQAALQYRPAYAPECRGHTTSLECRCHILPLPRA
jgi:hypothetical protein